jgi:hypothetical protein
MEVLLFLSSCLRQLTYIILWIIKYKILKVTEINKVFKVIKVLIYVRVSVSRMKIYTY